jgi:L-fuculose-phosphate aldolase
MHRARRADTETPMTIGLADEAAARAEVVACAKALSARGLSPGRSGNVSRRFGDGLLITPSGLACDAMTAEMIVRLGPSGAAVGRSLKPSSETPFHRAIYAARPDCSAIVHTHSMHATVLACAHRPIPAFHYMVAAAGGADIPCVPYATFGSETLSRHVAAGLAKRNACLMANHGMVAIGPTLRAALELAAEVEGLAEQYYKVLQLGAPHILDHAEMARVHARFARYGAAANSEDAG